MSHALAEASATLRWVYSFGKAAAMLAEGRSPAAALPRQRGWSKVGYLVRQLGEVNNRGAVDVPSMRET